MEQSANPPQSSWRWLEISLLGILTVVICFWNLDTNSFHFVDETTHVRVTQEALHGNGIWTPTVFGLPYRNKPPLKMWLSLIPVSILGESNTSYRLLDGLCGSLTILLIYCFAHREFGRRWAAAVTALGLLGSKAYFFVHGVRNANQDSMLVLCTTATFLLGWLFFEALRNGEQRKRLFRIAVAGGLTVGIGALTKSVAAYVPLAVIGVFALASGDWRRVVKEGLLPFLLLVFISLLLPAIYLIPHCAQDGGVCTVMFKHEILERATNGYHNVEDVWFYVKRIFIFRSAVAPELLVLAVGWALVMVAQRRDRLSGYLLAWSVIPVILFSAMSSRLTWYIAPAFPGMALLVGAGVTGIYEWLKLRPCAAGKMHCGIRGALVALTIATLGFQLGVVLDRVFWPENRLELDVLAHGMKDVPDATIVSYREPVLARNEKVYRDMFRNVRTATSPEELRPLLTAKTIVLASVNNFSELAGVGGFDSYGFFAPTTVRQRWLVALGYNMKPTGIPKPLRELKAIVDPGEAVDALFLYGWSGKEKRGGVTVRATEGSQAAVVLEGDLAHRELGAVLTLNWVGVSNRNAVAKVTLNDSELGEVKVPRGDFRSTTFNTAGASWFSGKNVLTLKFRFEDEPQPAANERMALVNWISVRVRTEGDRETPQAK